MPGECDQSGFVINPKKEGLIINGRFLYYTYKTCLPVIDNIAFWMACLKVFNCFAGNFGIETLQCF